MSEVLGLNTFFQKSTSMPDVFGFRSNFVMIKDTFLQKVPNRRHPWCETLLYGLRSFVDRNTKVMSLPTQVLVENFRKKIGP